MKRNKKVFLLLRKGADKDTDTFKTMVKPCGKLARNYCDDG